MKYEIITVRKMIDRISFFSDDYVMYINGDILSKDANILLALNDEYNLPDHIMGFKRHLGCGDVEGIIDNLQSQNPAPTLDDYIEAINYYIENDAFIDVENRENKPQGGFKIWG